MSLWYVQCDNPQCKAIGCRQQPMKLCPTCETKVPDKNPQFKCKLCGSSMSRIRNEVYEHLLHSRQAKSEEGLLSPIMKTVQEPLGRIE